MANKQFNFQPYYDVSKANLAEAFKPDGKHEGITPGAGTDPKDTVIYFWNEPTSGRVIFILRPEKNVTKKQLDSIESWLKANYFRLAKPDERWKSGANNFANAPANDVADSDNLTHEVGLFVAMMKKSEVTQKRVDAGLAAVINWLKTPWKDTIVNNGGAQPANNGGSKPADNKSGNNGAQPANKSGNNGAQPANKSGNNGGAQPANNGGSKPAAPAFKYDDNAGGAANLDAYLRSLGWNMGDNK